MAKSAPVTEDDISHLSSIGVNPRIVELIRHLCETFLTAYEATVEERPSIAKNEQIDIAVSRIFGRSSFSMKSVLDGFPGLNLERARALTALYELSGKASLGEVREHMGLTRQAAYSRLQSLLASGYAEKKETSYGMYFLTKRGEEAAKEIANLD